MHELAGARRRLAQCRQLIDEFDRLAAVLRVGKRRRARRQGVQRSVVPGRRSATVKTSTSVHGGTGAWVKRGRSSAAVAPMQPDPAGTTSSWRGSGCRDEVSARQPDTT